MPFLRSPLISATHDSCAAATGSRQPSAGIVGVDSALGRQHVALARRTHPRFNELVDLNPRLLKRFLIRPRSTY
jgi:hypothetical protein